MKQQWSDMKKWVKLQWARLNLDDIRCNARAINVAINMIKNPAESLS